MSLHPRYVNSQFYTGFNTRALLRYLLKREVGTHRLIGPFHFDEHRREIVPNHEKVNLFVVLSCRLFGRLFRISQDFSGIRADLVCFPLDDHQEVHVAEFVCISSNISWASVSGSDFLP